jgi:hypothetical protein
MCLFYCLTCCYYSISLAENSELVELPAKQPVSGLPHTNFQSPQRLNNTTERYCQVLLLKFREDACILSA